ncbi:activating molecule in BECN1-regulated autophagy protein 1A-like isoform X2 [Eriocheir sinensis]|uniref:activating molecule in BECN1-regulated autophagy protein 1A-like isoform X2 n=1 Tax=Eriocheir sinensis TaxID=95602 RepID=UPI0021C71F0A|nr:activating molecule in BECN1-regulated autophagy protein 1A-like isoform X2 [Eriocheir sinensis]
MMGQRQTLWKQSSESWGGRHNRLHYQGDCLPGSYSIMDDMFLEGKMEVGEEVRRQCHDPMLAPTPVLLARREVPARHPQATTTQLHHISEEMLVYRKHNLLSCQLPGSPKSTFLMVFSPDGSKVASTHGDHNIYVSEVNTGQCICTLEGHPRTPWCVAFHPASNEIVASGCLGGEVRVWGLKGGSEVWTTEKSTVIASLAFHPTDKVLLIATYNEIYFWDWFQPQPFTKICTADEKEKVRYVKFDPLGHKLITGIANMPHERPGSPSTHHMPSRSELVEREQRYSQLSSQYLSLVSHLEALTSSSAAAAAASGGSSSAATTAATSSTSTTSASRTIDRGTDPIELGAARRGR